MLAPCECTDAASKGNASCCEGGKVVAPFRAGEAGSVSSIVLMAPVLDPRRMGLFFLCLLLELSPGKGVAAQEIKDVQIFTFQACQ